MIINPRTAIEEGWITFPDREFEEVQLQPNGIDVRMMNACKIPDDGMVTLYKDQPSPRVPYCSPSTCTIGFRTLLTFRRLTAYLIDLYEWVKIPEGVCAEIIGRSTLNMNGIFARSTLYDSGFNNYAGIVIFPFRMFRCEVGARIAQIVFYEAKTSHLYSGRNNRENFERKPLIPLPQLIGQKT